MTSTQLRDKLRKEILSIPESRLQEVYDFIHYFRLGLERDEPTKVPDIMRFAGAWEDMKDFDALEEELRERRHTIPPTSACCPSDRRRLDDLTSLAQELK